MAMIAIENVWKQFQLNAHVPRTLKESLVHRFKPSAGVNDKTFWALQDVSFEIERGETFGIIGNNGSGKSTLLKLITGISKPTKGKVSVNGSLSALLELGAGFHPDFSGRENVFLNGAILGLRRKEIEARFDSIVAFAEMERFIDNPVKTYSSGMYMRLAFSIAIHVDPDILVIDEVLAVGDSAFQQKCYDQIQRFKHNGKTIVFVSHSLPVVQDICQRAAWIDRGILRALGKTETVLDFYSQQISDSIERNKAAEPLVPDGRARVSNIRALDASGIERAILQGDGPASFIFDLETHCDPCEIEIFVRIARSDGTCCYDQRVSLKALAEASGSGRLELAVPELRLNTGSYNLQISVMPPGREVPFDEKFFNFAVESLRRGPGVANLGAVCSWTPDVRPVAPEMRTPN
jgi:ABC-type polysaccharide/polyol phosphate transport system ATPase subunit